MAFVVKVPTVKPNDSNLIAGHTWGKERTNSHKLSFKFHMQEYVHKDTLVNKSNVFFF